MLEPGDAIDAEVDDKRTFMPVASDPHGQNRLSETTATTSKRPPDDRRCTAKSKRTHVRCGRYSTPGLKVCRWHGGATKASLALARRNLQMQAAHEIVATREVEPMSDPVDSLLRIARRVEMVAELIGERLDEASDADAVERVALIGSYRSCLLDCHKVTSSVVALGLLEMRTRPPEEATARAVGQAVDAAITDDAVGLTFDQIESFRRVLRVHMAEAFSDQ